MVCLCTSWSGSPGGLAAGKPRPGSGSRNSGASLELWRPHGPDRLVRHRLPPCRLLPGRLLRRGWKLAAIAWLKDCSLRLGTGVFTRLLTGPLAVELLRDIHGHLLGIREVTCSAAAVALRAPTEEAWPTRIRRRQAFALGRVVL